MEMACERRSLTLMIAENSDPKEWKKSRN